MFATPTIRTLADLIEAINDERSVSRADVPQRVQNAAVWHAIVSFPGCLGDSHSVARSREAALGSVEYWLDDSESSKEFSARYVRGQLRRHGVCYLRDGRVITLDQHCAGNLL